MSYRLCRNIAKIHTNYIAHILAIYFRRNIAPIDMYYIKMCTCGGILCFFSENTMHKRRGIKNVYIFL